MLVDVTINFVGTDLRTFAGSHIYSIDKRYELAVSRSQGV